MFFMPDALHAAATRCPTDTMGISHRASSYPIAETLETAAMFEAIHSAS